MTATVPLYVVLCAYGGDALSLRDAAIAEHLSYLRGNRHRLRFAGPLLDDDNQSATGSLAIVEVADRAKAEDFIAGEAFYRAGMFSRVEIVRFASAVGQRQASLTDSGRQMFLCWWRTSTNLPYDGCPSLPRADASVGWLEGGVLLSDDGTRVVGGLCIIEVTDRHHAEGVVALDVERWSAADARTLVTRWRFGQALGGADDKVPRRSGIARRTTS
jgi:uncharacterized protein YciI